MLAAFFFLSILVVGAIPGEAEMLAAKIPDKALHFFAYSFLSILIYASVSGGLLIKGLLTLAVIALLGGVDEALQSLMPYRSADLRDWQFDMFAAATSILFLNAVQLIYLSAKKAK